MNAIRHATFPRDTFFGFDNIFDTIERINSTTQKSTGYPPYNVVKIDSEHLVIEIAVAGFTAEEIDMTLEKGELTIKGVNESNDDMQYVHRGIGSRNFTRKFTLADTMKVVGADIVDGLLKIGLENQIPEEDKPVTINLGNLTKSAKQLLLG
jgi:molecular chaperone IbpA